MKDVLKTIYLAGFEEDRDTYATYFCDKNANCAVVYPSDNPVSAGYVIEKKLSDGNKCVYFSAISTLKSERGKGCASKLISQMLKLAYNKDYPFAVLSPFSSTFYKRYGFFTTQFYNGEQINGRQNVQVFEVTDNDVGAICKLFDSNATRLAFDEEYVKDVKEESSVYGAKLLRVELDGKTVAFCVTDGDNVTRVIQNGIDLSSVSNFSGRWIKSPTKFGEAFIQLRILSLEKFVSFLSPLSPFSVTVKVVDDILDKNANIWRIFSNGYDVKAKKVLEKTYDFEIGIDRLVEQLEKLKCINPFVTQFIDEY